MGNLINSNYTLIGDFIAILIAIVLFFLRKGTIINQSQKFKILTNANKLIVLSAIGNITYHILIPYVGQIPNVCIFIPRCVYYISLLAIWLQYNLYLDSLIDLPENTKKIQKNFMLGGFLFFSGLIILSPITKFGFYIKNGTIHKNYILDPFTLAYIFFLITISIGLFKYRENFSRKILQCIINVVALSVGTMMFQLIFENNSFTIVTFALPIVLMFFLFHANSYDYSTGTLNKDSCYYYIFEKINNKKKYHILFLELEDGNKDDSFFKKMKKVTNIAFNNCFTNIAVFRLRDELFCVVYDDVKFQNEDEFRIIAKEIYEKYKISFKLINLDNNLTSKFLNLNEIEVFYEWNSNKINFNEIVFLNDKYFKEYKKEKEILLELEDIYNKRNLNDERVLVYCQPIWNIEKKQFLSAEILMRLNLNNKMIYPNSFIELAEENGYIHTLSLIILNKACLELKRILSEGYQLNRISINFSIMELNEVNFCKEVEDIILNSKVDGNNIAIELTESREDKNFLLVESILSKLKELNIKFYLDDFGTGYSNFERIMKLPIDVIKFDRSMLLLTKEDEEFKYMVKHFAEIFNNLQYDILFEGVEDEHEEDICINMNANYLQGYKYSKPIPFEQIRTFLVKNNC